MSEEIRYCIPGPGFWVEQERLVRRETWGEGEHEGWLMAIVWKPVYRWIWP